MRREKETPTANVFHERFIETETNFLTTNIQYQFQFHTSKPTSMFTGYLTKYSNWLALLRNSIRCLK